MLTGFQQTRYKDFWEVINHRGSLFFDAKDRGVGKTYLINEIGLELQSLGYEVFIVSPVDCIDYYAERKLSLDTEDYRGRLYDNTVILLDEVLVSEKFSDFVNYCKDRQVPVIGFVRYPLIRESKPIDFKREYKCSWV